MSFLNRSFVKIVLILIVLAAPVLFAGTTGKIAGRVIEKASGDPLPLVNVMIVGESKGAATDADGNYIILNIKPGTYTVKATMLGYAESIVTGIVVRADLTTRINFELVENSIEIGEIVVNAKQTLMNKDETSRMEIISSKTFSDLPVASFQDAVSLQSGFVVDDDGLLHARGGRSG